MSNEYIETEISGLLLFERKVIADERGAVMHMLKSSSRAFDNDFGEVYFSRVTRGVIKGWKKHLEMRQRFVVPVGEVQFVFFDDRVHSESRGRLVELKLSPEFYRLVIVPNGVWYSFKGSGTPDSLVVNCASLEHDPLEVVTLPLGTDVIPYKWLD